MDIDVEGNADADAVPLIQEGGAVVSRRHGIGEMLLLPSPYAPMTSGITPPLQKVL